MSEKRVYTFGNGKAEGNAQMREQLGGKGANLAEMNLIGVPVPPGFTITTDTCNEYYRVGQDRIVELLRLTDDEKNDFYSKAAAGRHELPKDIVEYLTNNQAEIDGLRERMRAY